MTTDKFETVMEKARQRFDESGLSLEELGQRMGYEEGTARRAAWQFLRKTSDPRLSMIYRFAEALEIPVEELVTEKRRK